MTTPRGAAVLAVATTLMLLASLTSSATAQPRVAEGIVVHVSEASGQVVFARSAAARLRSIRVGRTQMTGLGRGHRIAVRMRRGVAHVERIGSGRARGVSFLATVADIQGARPVLRLARGITVVGPRPLARSRPYGDDVLVRWRLSPRRGAIQRFTVSARPGGTDRADGRITSARKRPKPASAPAAPDDTSARTTEPTPTPAPSASGNIVFGDEFTGGSGAPADPSKWVLRGEVCDDFTAYSCPKNSNVFQDGAGNLVLRVQREATNWLGGGPYSGAFLGTFQYESGWPPRVVTASWSVPYRIEMRALMPAAPGLWSAAWDMNVDRTPAQGPWELDWAEQRTTYPTSAGCYQHRWVNGVDVAPWWGALPVTDMSGNWHVYSADVFDDRVEYRVDGDLCGVAPGVQGRFGLLLDLVMAKPGSWGAGGGAPAPSDPGPWDMKIDYVRVTR